MTQQTLILIVVCLLIATLAWVWWTGRKPAPPRRSATEEAVPLALFGAAETTLVFYVVQRERQTWPAAQLHAVLQAVGLQFGDKRVYHCLKPYHEQTASVFLVASMLEPGTLDPAEAAELHTFGLCLILHLPGPVPATAALNEAVLVLDVLSRELDAEVWDSARQPLTLEGLNALHDQLMLKDKIAAF